MLKEDYLKLCENKTQKELSEMLYNEKFTRVIELNTKLELLARLSPTYSERCAYNNVISIIND